MTSIPPALQNLPPPPVLAAAARSRTTRLLASRLEDAPSELDDEFRPDPLVPQKPLDPMMASPSVAAPADDGHRLWHHRSALPHGSHSETEQHASGNAAKHLVQVTARGELNGKEGWHDILLPSSWVAKLEPSSITVNDGGARHPYYVGQARLASKPSRSVSFAAMPTGEPETDREIAIAKLLGSTGFAPEVLETAAFDEVTFLVTESPGTEQLGAVLARHAPRGEALPVGEAVTLMADLLQSLKVLERVGIVHGDLTEEHIYVVDYGAHAMITDFRHACMGSGELGCGVGDDDELVGSAFRQAPEMKGERASNVANDVWQLGLVFARMLFGGEVTTASQLKRSMSLDKLDDSTRAGRERIRETVRETFSVKDALAAKELPADRSDLVEVVEGMLEKNPEKRWSAAKACAAIQEAVQRRQIFVPMPREPPAMVEDWLLAWQ